MVLQTQRMPAVASSQQEPKRQGWFRCCVAAPDTDSTDGELDYVKAQHDIMQQQPINVTRAQQRTGLRWKQLQQREEEQQSAAIRTVTISSSVTPSDSSNDAAAASAAVGLLQAETAAGLAAVPVIAGASASNAATCGSAVPCRTATALTDSTVRWAAAKTTAAATTVQRKTTASSTAVVQQLAAEGLAHRSTSITQQQQQEHNGNTNSSSLSSGIRLLDALNGSRSASNSCHATVSSDSTSNCSSASAAAAATAAEGIANTGGVAAANTVEKVARAPAGVAETTNDNRDTSTAAVTAEITAAIVQPAAAEPAVALYREISLSPASTPAAPAAASDSATDFMTGSSNDNNNLEPMTAQGIASKQAEREAAVGRAAGAVAKEQAGIGFRFSSNGSFQNVAAGTVVTAAAASTDAAAKPAGASPFAQLALQKTVTDTLLPSSKQQQGLSSMTTAAAASVASFSSATAAAAAAAVVTRVSSSSGPAALGPVTPRASRISWATSSTVLGADPAEVFEILDPETSSTPDNELRILRKSASTNSMSGLAAASSSSSNAGSSAKEKLKQLRGVMSFGGSTRPKTAPAAAAAAAGSSADPDGPSSSGSSSSRFKGVWRRSTDNQAVSTSLQNPDNSPAARRSKSAHTSILAQQQQQQLRQQQLSDPGQRLPPPYPTAASTTAAAVGGNSSSSLGSSGRLASGEAQSSSSSVGLNASSSNNSPRLAVPDKGRLSLESGLRTASSGGSTGSLVSVAVNRMQTTKSAPLPNGQPTNSSSSSGSSSGVQLSSMGSIISTASSSAAAAAGTGNADPSRASSIQVANAFAEAFLAALAAGNTKWSSETVVAQLISDSAKMLGMDKQLYIGRTAIIRRLNSGMEQLVKMVSAYVDNNSSTSSSSGSGAAAGSQSNVMADLANQLPKPLLSVTCPDPRGKPSSVVAVYTFKWGIRKFTLKDELIVKNGQIMRLRRSRS